MSNEVVFGLGGAIASLLAMRFPYPFQLAAPFRWLCVLALIIGLGSSAARAQDGPEPRIDMYFYSPTLKGLTDAVLPGRIVWLKVDAVTSSVIVSGTVTVTLPPELTYVGYRDDIGPWDSVTASGQVVTINVPEGELAGRDNVDIWLYVRTASLDDLPPIAPKFTITTEVNAETSRHGVQVFSETFESALLYARINVTSNKQGQSVEAGDRIRYTVEVSPYPHYEVVFARVAAFAPYYTDLDPGSVSGLNGAVAGADVRAEFASGGVRSFNFSYEVVVRDQFQLDYNEVTEFVMVEPGVQFRVRTPYTGNPNSPGREFHQRVFETSAGPMPVVEREVPQEGSVVNSMADRPRDPTREDCGTGETLENGEPECTLRSVIEGVNAGIADAVRFDILTPDFPTITLESPLPALTRSVTIDGTTQIDGMVEVRANGLNAIGIDLQGGASEVRGLIISGFTGPESAAIRLKGGEGNVIAGNWIGVTQDGSAAGSNHRGIIIEESASNVIGGTSSEDANIVYSLINAIQIRGESSDGNQVVGNRIGIAENGAALEPAGNGVVINGGDQNRIGASGAGNLIAGAVGVAVSSDVAIAGTSIVGNRIGLEADGKTATNGGVGILLAATSDVPVTTTLVSGNRIAGMEAGILAAGAGLAEAQIEGNTLGLDFLDTGSLPEGLDELSQQYGLRIDGASQQTITDNLIAGHAFNVQVAGNVQFYLVPGEDTDGDGLADTSGEFELYNILDPRAVEEGEDLGGHVTVEANTIGLNPDEAAPPGREQKVGVGVFGKAGNVTVRDNIVAGHLMMDVYLQDGDGHTIGGNRIGTATGQDFGGAMGVRVDQASNVVIGASGDMAGNLIARESLSGIVVAGSAETVLIKGNKIGTDVGATSAWPNGSGITIAPDDSGGEPTGVVIEDNIIAGNAQAGVRSSASTEAQLRNNFIGVNANGLVLPNAVGVSFAGGGHARSEGDTIARNTLAGISAEASSSLLIRSPSIYLNGTGAGDVGIAYDEAPFAPPSKVVALRSKPDENGTVTLIVAVAPPGGAGATVEVFGNSAGEAQGRTLAAQRELEADEPFVEEYEVAEGSSFTEFANLTATYTQGESTSSFSAPAEVEDIILPDLRIEYAEGELALRWSLLEYYRIVSGPTPDGPWTPAELVVKREGGGFVARVEVGEEPVFFSLELDAAAVFDHE